MSYFGSPSQPDFTSAISSIQGMTSEQLEAMLHDESRFEALIQSLEQVKRLCSEKEALMASNRQLAEYNLSQEPRLTEARIRLEEKHREATKATERVRVLKREMDEKSGTTDPETLLALLQTAHAEAEEESDKMADDFLHSRTEGGVDQFLEEFLEKRKVAHMRRIKADKMKELIMNGDASKTTPTRRAPAPPPAAAVYNVPSPNSWGNAPVAAVQPPPYPAAPNSGNLPNLPYPIRPTGMPMGPGGY